MIILFKNDGLHNFCSNLSVTGSIYEIFQSESDNYRFIIRILCCTVLYTKHNSVCVAVCLNSSKTARKTNIKLGTIDCFLGMSVIRGSWRHDDVTIKDKFFLITFLDQGNWFLA